MDRSAREKLEEKIRIEEANLSYYKALSDRWEADLREHRRMVRVKKSMLSKLRKKLKSL